MNKTRSSLSYPTAKAKSICQSRQCMRPRKILTSQSIALLIDSKAGSTFGLAVQAKVQTQKKPWLILSNRLIGTTIKYRWQHFTHLQLQSLIRSKSRRQTITIHLGKFNFRSQWTKMGPFSINRPFLRSRANQTTNRNSLCYPST